MRKKAFSLIEIMQTVILLGIIAGLSVSFFKKVNNDEKLYTATEKAVIDAVNEAGRQMCNDYTPYCRANGFISADVKWQNGNTTFRNVSGELRTIDMSCAAGYKGATYNANTGYCEATVAAADPCPTKTRVYFIEMQKTKDLTKCIAPPSCPDSDGESAYTATKADTYNSIVCPNGVPNFAGTKDVNITYGGTTYTEVNRLCYYMHDLLNHKKQGNSDDDDLYLTCATPDGSDGISFQPSMIPKAIGNAFFEKIDKLSDAYNIKLPNGVTLYNVGASFGTGDTITIFVKYDRIPQIKNSVWGKNVKCIRVNKNGSATACTENKAAAP